MLRPSTRTSAVGPARLMIATAEALDEDRRSLGPAETRAARGLVFITPVKKAFSYLLRRCPVPPVRLTSDRDEVVPGETVTVAGRAAHSFQVPPGARPGTRRSTRFLVEEARDPYA